MRIKCGLHDSLMLGDFTPGYQDCFARVSGEHFMRHSLAEAPSVTNVVLDGAAIVQKYAHQVFLPYTSGQLQCVSRLDQVWDSYVVDSLKETAKAKRGERSAPMRHCICTHTEKLAQLPTCRPQQAGTLKLPPKSTHPII